MRTACKMCGYQFESLILDKEMAFKEIEEKSTRHVAQKHPGECKEMQKAVAVIMPALLRVLHFGEFVMVPTDEEFVEARIDKSRDIVMAALGYDPEDMYEEEEEEEGELEPDEVELTEEDYKDIESKVKEQIDEVQL